MERNHLAILNVKKYIIVKNVVMESKPCLLPKRGLGTALQPPVGVSCRTYGSNLSEASESLFFFFKARKEYL